MEEFQVLGQTEEEALAIQQRVYFDQEAGLVADVSSVHEAEENVEGALNKTVADGEAVRAGDVFDLLGQPEGKVVRLLDDDG